MEIIDKPEELKTVDVIIPVYHPGEEFNKLLKRLREQDYDIRHIILMHTEDGQELGWTEKTYDNVIVKSVDPNEFDHGGTRDEGIRSTDADIVLCMTQDAMPADRKMVRMMVQSLQENKVAAVYARQLPNEDCDVMERFTRKFNYPNESRIKSKNDLEEMGIKTYFCSNVCAAYKKHIYMNMGGFEKHTIFNEDMIFAAKLIQSGYKIAYQAGAKVIHSHNYTNLQQFRRNFDLAVSQAQHPEIFSAVRSESEGIRLVRQTASYLMKMRRPFLIGRLVVSSGAKYMGYRFGRCYRKLPHWLILKLTMNPRYWAEN